MSNSAQVRSEDNPPDWDKLGQLASEAKELWNSGNMTKEKYEEFLERGERLVHGWGEYLECLALYNPDPFSDDDDELEDYTVEDAASDD